MTTWIRRNHGRKLGLLRFAYHSLIDRMGGYTRLRIVHWSRVERLVFVCRGNICRSAYAEARARALGIEAISFGLATPGGDEPPPQMLEASAWAGLGMADHRSRTVASAVLARSDLILAMEPAHLKQLRDLPLMGVQVTLLGLWGRPRRPYIGDPYGLSAEYFRTCIGLIDEAIAGVAGRIGAGSILVGGEHEGPGRQRRGAIESGVER